ncbi:hypothetical protein C8Q80DRAFT_1140494 [Daedaleopsis nitida]|nr:hypothetical protein C8Q80DRAFT_1140494 [Daedaleopsis nitida]
MTLLLHCWLVSSGDFLLYLFGSPLGPAIWLEARCFKWMRDVEVCLELRSLYSAVNFVIGIRSMIPLVGDYVHYLALL